MPDNTQEGLLSQPGCAESQSESSRIAAAIEACHERILELEDREPEMRGQVELAQARRKEAWSAYQAVDKATRQEERVWSAFMGELAAERQKLMGLQSHQKALLTYGEGKVPIGLLPDHWPRATYADPAAFARKQMVERGELQEGKDQQ